MAARQDDNMEDCAMFGQLQKLGAKGLVKSWKKRIFVAKKDSRFVEYYRHYPDEAGPQGTIDLADVTQVRPCENNLSLKKEKGEWAFEVITPDRVYYLLAPDEKTMQYWISGIQNLTSSVQDGGCGNAFDVNALSDSMREELALNTPQYGQLFVNIIEAAHLSLSKDRGHLGVYCVMTMDKQVVKTQVVKDLKAVRWNEGFFFDVTGIGNPDHKVSLTIAVWAHNISQAGGECLGFLTVPVASLYHQKPIDQSFKLQRSDGQRASGELHVKLQVTLVNAKITKDDFHILKVIGRGNFGKVMQVRKKDTGRIYAMKVLRKDTVIAADAVQHTLSETNVLRRIHHPFIVNLKYSFQTEDKLYMVMDYLSGGELFYHLSSVDRFSEERARFYAAEIIEALGYLHRNHVVYRDLKPENLLLDISGHVCLTDFGLVKEGVRHGDVTHTFCGSPEYLAPEILQGKGYGKEVDWWALGTFLYEMLKGLPPFYDEDIAEMNRKILCAPLKFPAGCFSPQAKSLLRGLLERDPKRRLGSGESDYEELKAHPFFASIDWDKLFRKEIEPMFKPHLQSAEDVRYFDPEFTCQTPKDSFYESQLAESRQDLFSGFSYVSTSAFEQLIKQRRKISATVQTNSDRSTDSDSPTKPQSPSPKLGTPGGSSFLTMEMMGSGGNGGF